MNNMPGIKIAIADDHAIVRKGIAELLNQQGAEVSLEASNGKELINGLEQLAVLPEICMLDINMPVLNGYDTAKILNKKWPQIKTLVFTDFLSEYSFIRMLNHGAKGYILKSAPLTEICRAVNDLADSGAGL